MNTFNIGDRVVSTIKDGIYAGAIGTIVEIREDAEKHQLGVQRDGFRGCTGFSFDEVKLFKPKYDWKYGDNGNQEYYDVTVDNTYLLVFKNRWDSCWMCSVNDRMIHDKTRNDVQRKKQGLEKGCDISLLHRDTMLCSQNPFKLIKKTEWCFEHNIDEISA